ncbi:AAA family ATPase [Mucilaginibacter sp. dw_454]|uniref:AAA family ATPase n=1 Tax=Mucilaginibacter sp. dw_454 TaxID=2720079 RepID=UPI001BD635EF|nr:AAA family ATPase [Mucilaginibacter sp. dw_454]
MMKLNSILAGRETTYPLSLMIFRNITELSKAIDKAAGIDFIKEFQYTSKRLKGALRISGLQLFGNPHDEDKWAINKGGGTEIQYHISFDNDTVFYGLGFSAQYVPFKNAMYPVDYIRPFMKAFLAKEAEITAMLPDYRFVWGNRSELVKPRDNTFTLFGKELPVQQVNDSYELQDSDLNILINDLKRQLPVYSLIYTTKNQSFANMQEIAKYTDLLLTVKPQLILQGAPGTGKTYTAQEIAHQLIFKRPMSKEKAARDKEILKLRETGQYEFVQFHPAYAYEDFIRGIAAKAKDNAIEYKAENKTFTNFALLANQNLLDSKKTVELTTREEWTQQMIGKFQGSLETQLTDTGKIKLTDFAYITRITNSTIRYKGDTWDIDGGVPYTDLKEMYLKDVKTLQEIRELPTLSLSAKGNSSYWLKILELFRTYLNTEGVKEPSTPSHQVEEKPFILVIDEINRASLPAVLGELIFALEYRNVPVKSIYDLDEGENLITVPSNLYIIGTMNTADRSVGHLDYAIRRRFVFADITPDVDVISLPQAKVLFKQVETLFANEDDPSASIYIASEFDAKDVMPGHSYFLADNVPQLKLKFIYEILPLLHEYVKDGILTDLPDEKIRACYDALTE